MKTLIRSVSLVLAFSTASLFAETFSLEDYTFSIKNSSGVSFSGTSTLTGVFGVFSSGFTPTNANLSSWQTSFTAGAGSVSYIDASSPEWNIGFTNGSNASPFTSGAQLSLWVFNSQAVSASSQWVLLTDSSWKITTYDPLNLPVGFSFTANTIAQFGSYDFGNSVINTATATAVPEPATYAAALGVMVLGVVGYRRFRKK